MRALICLAVGLCAAAACLPAQAQKADVIHFWTSGGESRAVAVFAHEYEKRGGTWVDDPAIGPQAEIALAMNRIAGGQSADGDAMADGRADDTNWPQQGLLANLDWLAEAGRLEKEPAAAPAE